MIRTQMIRWLLGSICLSVLMLAARPPHAFANPAVTADENGVYFTLQTPEFELTADGRLIAPNLEGKTQTPGAPELPYYKALIAIPPHASVDLSVQAAAVTQHAVTSIRPVGQPVSSPTEDLASTLDQFNFVYEPDAAIYTTNALYPEQLYTLSDPQQHRNLQMVELALYPFRYNPVTQIVEHAADLQIALTFSHSQTRNASVPVDSTTLRTVEGALLNPEQAALWGTADQPAARITTAGTQLPVGSKAYKITVTQDGIYELTRSKLQTAGFPVNSVDAAGVKMMHQGQPVHYQIVNHTANSRFDETESIRFYGWSFDGSAEDKLYVPLATGSNDLNRGKNVFWLWASDDGTQISSSTPPNTTSGTQTTYTATVTAERDRIFSSTKLDEPDWNALPNEPDNMFWDIVVSTTSGEPGSETVDPETVNFPIYLSHPAAGGPDATLTVELLSLARDVFNPDTFVSHEMSIDINAKGYDFAENWLHLQYINATHAVAVSDLVHGNNNVAVTNSSQNSPLAPNYLPISSEVYVNRIQVEYLADLAADSDQLIFQPQAGSYTFQLDGFTETSTANMLGWDISTPTAPHAITLVNEGSGTYSFAHTAAADGNIIVTAANNILTPSSVAAYTVKDLEPAGGARWIAITHAKFLNAATTLAAHRTDHTHIATHVVDVADIYNQYGYGNPTPQAIHAYITHAYNDWATSPNYITFIGDASYNPRKLDCSLCTEAGADWDNTSENYIPTYFKFVDRFQGSIPSDYAYSLMDGDLYPDVAIGRISVETAVQANSAVEKIMLYEANLVTPEAYLQNILFVHDNKDDGGDFYSEILNGTVEYVDGFDNFANTIVGLPQFPTDADFTAVRTAMFSNINSDGVTLLNWRGHGSIDTWGQKVMRVNPDAMPGSPLTNFTKPFVTISMDCLDGNFIYPGLYSLSESLLRLNDSGSSAHWSSSGLGFTQEHTVLAQSFYAGLFNNGLTAIGDAVNHAKMVYHQRGQHPSELYSFILQGDPAMQLFQPELSVNATVNPNSQALEAGETVKVTFSIKNDGSYPSHPSLRYPLPAGFSYVSHTSAAPMTLTKSNGDTLLIFDGQEAIDYQETSSLTVTLKADVDINDKVSSIATLSGTGLDLSPQNGRSVTVIIGGNSTSTGGKTIYLPFVTR